MRKLLIAVGALLAFPAAAEASDWYRVGVNDLGVTYTDREAVVRDGEGLIVWEYVIWHVPADTGMVRIKARMAIDCRDRSYRSLNFIAYRQDGTTRNWDSRYDMRRRAEPGTIAENLIMVHCGDLGRGVRLGAISPEQDALLQAR